MQESKHFGEMLKERGISASGLIAQCMTLTEWRIATMERATS